LAIEAGMTLESISKKNWIPKQLVDPLGMHFTEQQPNQQRSSKGSSNSKGRLFSLMA